MYKSLFDEVPCYLTLVSNDYKIVKANRAFRENFGELEGKDCFAAYKGLGSKCPDCPVEKTFQSGESHQSEEIWNLNGKQANVFVTTSPIVDKDGNVLEVLEMSVDVTRIKRLQRELEKRQREYRQLFEKAPCYLTVVDRDYQIIQANQLFERDFGQGIGRKCFRVYKKRESRCDNCPVEKTFIDGNTHTSEEVWRRQGEETHIIAYTAPLYDNSGNIFAVMEMCTNITEIKRLQSELMLLGETIAGMSHTIKNIVNGLQGGVYMVDSGLERSKRDRMEDGWRIVKKNVEKVSELVHGILYASKERQPEFRKIDPVNLLNEVCDLYENKAAKSGVELVRDFDDPMGEALLDPQGMHSVMSNLISNALQAFAALEEDGKKVTVSAFVADSKLNVYVTDNGPGIDRDVKRNLFSKFYSTKGSKGTGLGLVITRKIVQEHGGSIEVESEPGKGTSFRILIPWVTEEESSDQNGLALAVSCKGQSASRG
jgi:PAS domain S-box-containing protein